MQQMVIRGFADSAHATATVCARLAAHAYRSAFVAFCTASYLYAQNLCCSRRSMAALTTQRTRPPPCTLPWQPPLVCTCNWIRTGCVMYISLRLVCTYRVIGYWLYTSAYSPHLDSLPPSTSPQDCFLPVAQPQHQHRVQAAQDALSCGCTHRHAVAGAPVRTATGVCMLCNLNPVSLLGLSHGGKQSWGKVA